jgi:hypothetical protein
VKDKKIIEIFAGIIPALPGVFIDKAANCVIINL